MSDLRLIYLTIRQAVTLKTKAIPGVVELKPIIVSSRDQDDRKNPLQHSSAHSQIGLNSQLLKGYRMRCVDGIVVCKTHLRLLENLFLRRWPMCRSLR
jgi:hypothetical protein